MLFRKKEHPTASTFPTHNENEKNSKLIESLQLELNKKNDDLHHAISEINRLNQYIMKMDFVKEMIINLNLQLENIEMVAASSQEISASIIEIAEHVVDNTQAAEKSVNVTVQGTNALKNAVNSIHNAYEKTNEAKARVEDVTQQANKINEMVSIIEAVAGQTNLLALNASIEAARAGEAGRGFAVVADEIKKLADHTKESVKLIQDTVQSLNGSVKESVSTIEVATESFKVGMEDITSTSQLVETSEAEIRSILTSMEYVRDQIEAQTAASEEVASNVAQINESAKQLHKETTQTGKAFSDIALEVNNIRSDLTQRQGKLSTSAIIEMTITDHLMWRWDIYNMIMGFRKIPTGKLESHRECRLGRWIESEGKHIPEFQNTLQKIAGPHENLHKAADEAVRKYNSGDTLGAEQQLAKIDELARYVVNDLSSLLAVAVEREGGNKQVNYFKWTSDLTVYNDEIDEQHKQLLKIGEKLVSFNQSSNKNKQSFLAVAKELKDYTVYHFGHEESLLSKTKYPDFDRHQRIHKNFIAEISAVDFNAFDYNDPKAMEGLILFLSQWVIKHIKNEDFKYSSHLNKY